MVDIFFLKKKLRKGKCEIVSFILLSNSYGPIDLIIILKSRRIKKRIKKRCIYNTSCFYWGQNLE
jgi:hypothetical protein